jgi:hypothetical protein
MKTESFKALDYRNGATLDVRVRYGTAGHHVWITSIDGFKRRKIAEFTIPASVLDRPSSPLLPSFTCDDCGAVHASEAAAEDCCTLPEYLGGSAPAAHAACDVRPHAGQGGLRKHSIGELYPWTIAGRGGPDVEWQPVNLLDGRTGPRYAAYENAEAWIAVHRDCPADASCRQTAV